MLYFGRVGSSWGHRAFFGSSWREKVITLFFFFFFVFSSYGLFNKRVESFWDFYVLIDWFYESLSTNLTEILIWVFDDRLKRVW
jgi:hypothetical protein